MLGLRRRNERLELHETPPTLLPFLPGT